MSINASCSQMTTYRPSQLTNNEFIILHTYTQFTSNHITKKYMFYYQGTFYTFKRAMPIIAPQHFKASIQNQTTIASSHRLHLTDLRLFNMLYQDLHASKTERLLYLYFTNTSWSIQIPFGYQTINPKTNSILGYSIFIFFPTTHRLISHCTHAHSYYCCI